MSRSSGMDKAFATRSDPIRRDLSTAAAVCVMGGGHGIEQLVPACGEPLYAFAFKGVARIVVVDAELGQ